MSAASPATPLTTYVLRRSLTMLTPLLEQNARVLVRERQLRAEADSTARRLITVRRWQRVVYKTR
jgi:hypothetical protein